MLPPCCAGADIRCHRPSHNNDPVNMSTYLSADLRARLDAADDARCVYCQTTVGNTGQPLTVDHIIPTAQDGSSAFDNLCYACRRCNEYKGATIKSTDPLSGTLVPLFHPRHDRWDDHFAWDATGIRIVGLTPVGRATVIVLSMNNEYIVDARRRWVSAGWHPPRPQS